MHIIMKFAVAMGVPRGAFLIKSCMREQATVDIVWIVEVTLMDRIVKNAKKIIMNDLMVCVSAVTAIELVRLKQLVY